MPHVHQTTEIYTRRIEDTIEQLLERGEVISRAMAREMEYARRPSRQHIPCSSSVSRNHHTSTTMATTVTFQPTQQATKMSQAEEIEKPAPVRLPCERVLPCTRGTVASSAKVTVATNTVTEKRLVDPETNVEMHCYPVVLGPKKPESSAVSEKPRQFASRPMQYPGENGQEYVQQFTKQSTASSSSYQSQQTTMYGSKRIATQSRNTVATSMTREVVVRPKEERENWKKIFTHEGGDILKGHGSLEECRVKTVVFQSNDPANKWLRINQQWVQPGTNKLILNLWTDLLGTKSRNVWANGKELNV